MIARLLTSVLLLTVVVCGCTTKSTRAASSDTVNTDAKSTSQVQQGVGDEENPAPPPNDSGKPKPKASDLSNPTTN